PPCGGGMGRGVRRDVSKATFGRRGDVYASAPDRGRVGYSGSGRNVGVDPSPRPSPARGEGGVRGAVARDLEGRVCGSRVRSNESFFRKTEYQVAAERVLAQRAATGSGARMTVARRVKPIEPGGPRARHVWGRPTSSAYPDRLGMARRYSLASR